MYTLNYSISQLERLWDHLDTSHSIRIIHILTADSGGFSSVCEDRYIVLLDCEPATYTLLLML